MSGFPALTSGTARLGKAAQGLKNIQSATCYLNAVLQAVVHLPHLTSMPIAEWKKRCRCSENSTCWLCYLGLRVAASRGDGCEDQAPSWVVKRLHLLLPKSSTAKRQKSTPDNPDEVVLHLCQLSMEDCSDFFAAFIQKASPCDVTAEGGKGIVEHLFESQMVQEVSCFDCCTSRGWTGWHTLLMPLLYNGVRCSSIHQSLDLMMAPAAVSGECGTCHKDTERSMRTRCYTGGNVIVMQLDRHDYVSRKKCQEHVSFPDELNMQPWMHPESPDLAEGCSLVYDLVCIIVHKGRDYTNGHNIAVCRLGPGKDGCTEWAEYDDDKPVQKITWEEAAKKQATMLMWHRRHPRQQPLDTPHHCTIKAAVPGSQSVSAQSKGSGADITNSSSTSCLKSPTHHHYALDLPVPNLVEEPHAAAAVCPPSFGCPLLPSPLRGPHSLHPSTISYTQPDAVATVRSHAPLDTVAKDCQEPTIVATRSSDSSSCACPSSPPHHLAAPRPMSRPVCPSPQPPHRLHESKPRSRPPPSVGKIHSVVSHVVAEAQSGQQPQAATGAANSTARANNLAAAHHTYKKTSTTSQLSAAASKACGAAAAGQSAKANPTCRAGAGAPVGSVQTNSRAGAAAANGPAKTKSNRRAKNVAAPGPANANCCAGAVAAISPPQTRTRAKAASSGSANIMINKCSAAASTKKPLPVGSRPALSTTQKGVKHGSGYSILTRSKTRSIAEHATKDTASSTPKPAQRALPRKRQRAGASDDLPAQKKVAVSQAEVEVVLRVDAACTAMDVDQPSTTAATGRKRGGKSRKQQRAWR